MKVSPKIATGEKVTADEALCATGPKSSPTTAVNQLAPPTLVAPICPGQSSVTVGGTTINATLVLIKNTSTLIGYGGAARGRRRPQSAPPNVLAMNDKVQVAEYIGNIVAVSNVVTVGCHDVITYHNDNGRTGWNPNENTLTPANVKPGDFGLIATAKLDDDNDQVDGQPLIVTNQKIEGMGVHSVVYLATETRQCLCDRFVHRREAERGQSWNACPAAVELREQWKCGRHQQHADDRSQGGVCCTSSLTSWTALRPFTNCTCSTCRHCKTKVKPMTITATNALADGSTYTFDSSVQRQRPALLQANGNIYAGFGAYCDFKSSQSRGWVLGWSSRDIGAARKHPAAQQDSGDIHVRLLLPRSVDQQPSLLPGFLWMSGYGLVNELRRQPVFHHRQHGRQRCGGQFLRQRKRHRGHHGQDGRPT